MLQQEEQHLNYFEKELLNKQVRPTALLLFWHQFGYLLGAISGILGIKTAMLVTQSVEEVIERHYQNQIDYLKDTNIDEDLLNHIEQFQLDETAHKDTAITHESREAFLAPVISRIVKLICKAAISISKKI